MGIARIKTWVAEVLTPGDLNAEFDNLANNAAQDGANSDITSLSGLTTPLSIAQGGTAATTAAAARTSLGFPVADTDAIVKGSADATKLVRFEVDGLTTGTTRVVTIPDKDGTMAMTSDAIAPTIVDAKGDIIAATAADTVSRLAVGADGTVLTAASGQATGLQWSTPVQAASAAEMTASSSTTVYASPGTTRKHPGVLKAWAEFNGTGGSITANGYNINASVTDNGTGDYTINFVTAMTTTTYGIAGACIYTSGFQIVDFHETTPRATGSCRIKTGNSTSPVDPSLVSVGFYGEP